MSLFTTGVFNFFKISSSLAYIVNVEIITLHLSALLTKKLFKSKILCILEVSMVPIRKIKYSWFRF